MATFIKFILDRSGSMVSCRAQAIKGYNEFKATQLAIDPTNRISLLTFNDEVERVFTATPLSEASDLSLETYRPQGSTALYDAILTAIADIDAGESTMGDKILVWILTDGQENCSKNATHDAVMKAIQEKQDTGWWTFGFAMAGPEEMVRKTGMALGIPQGNIQAYPPTPAGTQAVFAASASSSAAYTRSNETSSRSLFVDPAIPSS